MRDLSVNSKRAVGAVLAILVITIAVLAVRADGFNGVDLELNDGSAWLVDIPDATTGRVNGAVREVEVRMRVVERGDDYRVLQAPGVLLVHNRTAQSLTPIEAASLSVGGSFTLPNDVDVQVGAGTVLLHRATDGAIWSLTVNGPSLSSLDPDAPENMIGTGGLATVGHDGSVHLLTDTGELTVTRRNGTTTTTNVEGNFTAISASAEDTVLLEASTGRIELVGDDNATFDVDPGLDYVLQQPSSTDRVVAVGSADGRLWVGPTDATASLELVTAGNGADLIEPVVVGNCVFTVSREEMRFIRSCGDETITMPLEGMNPGTRIRLFAANERVWVDALDSERAVYLPEEGDPEEIETWGSALFLGDDTEGEADNNFGNNLVSGDSGIESAALGDGEINQDNGGFEGGENQPPRARSDDVRARAGRSRVVPVLANDSDPNGDLLIVNSVESVPPEQGVVVVSPDRRTVQFTPAGGFTGLVSFGYEVSDGNGGIDRATVRIEVIDDDSNTAPEPLDDTAVARAGQEVSVPVLINDDDPEGDPLQLVSVSEGNGAVTVDQRLGIVTITPDSDARGEITFEYTVRDDQLLEGTATITVDVVPANGPNQRPVAEADLHVVSVGEQLTLSVLENDTDLEGDRLIITNFTSIVGDITLQPNAETGEVEFPTDTAGTYIYTYVLEDDNGPAERLGIVRVEVIEQTGNLPPVAVADNPPEFPAIEAGTTRTFNVLANDDDPNGDALVVVSVAPIGDDLFPLLGLVESPDGNFLFEPASELVGQEVTFQYTISDGFELATTTVTVQVIAPPARDEPPVAEDDRATVRAGQSILVDVLANDRDPENLPLEIAEGSFEQNPAPGITVLQEGLQLRVVATPEAASSVEFTYSARDAAEQTDSALVRVDVLPPEIPNQPPEARDIDVSTFAAEAVVIAALDSASDPDGDPLSIADVTGAENGIVEIVPQPGGQAVLRYTPDIGFVGTDSFTFIVADPDNAQDAAQVRVIVQEPPVINNPPNAVDDPGFSVRVGRSITIPVLANDRDIDGDVLSIARIGQPAQGAAVVEGNQITYTAPAEIAEATLVSLQYWVADGNPIVTGRDDAYTAVVTIEVIPPDPEPPTPQADVYGPFREGETHVLNVLENDTDPDGNRQDLSIVAIEGSSAVSISADNRTIDLLTPDEPFSFTYTVSDADQEVATAAVTVSVIPNRPPVAGVDRAEIRQQEFGELNVLENDVDEDDDPITLVAISDFRNGFAEIIDIDAGIVRFTPDDDVTQGGFSYRISDGPGGHEVTGTAQVTVLPPANTEPTASPGTFEVPAGETQTFNVLNLVDDTETPNNLTITSSGGNDQITIADLGNGSISIEAAIDGRGATTTVNYTVSDGGPGDPLSAESTIDITVIETRRPRPQVVGDGPFETDQGQSLTIDDLVANDLPNDQPLRIVAATPIAAGGGTITPTGDAQGVVYEPNPDFFGTFNFTYTIEDETGQGDRQATSGAVAIRVIGRPDAPTTIAAVASNGQVTLNWPTPNNNGGPITAYEVELDGNEIRDVGVGNTYIWDDLDNGRLYSFRVRAVNQAGPSDQWSQVSSAQPEALPGQPSPPTGIPSDQEIALSWSPPDAEGSDIIAYELDLVGGPTIELTETSHTWEGLTNGTNYQFRVRARTRAVENDGWGDWSNLSPQLIPFGLPGAPTGLVCSGELQAVLLTWNAANNNGAAISGYRVSLTNPTQSSAIANTGTSLTFGGLADGFTGTFVVNAINQAGEGSPSDPVTCTTPDRPDAPGGVSATSSPQQAVVTWNAPNDNGASITTYRVTSNTGIERTTSATSQTFDGLANGTAYSFTVEALNAVGWSPVSSQSNTVTPIDVPGAPTGVSATNQDDGQSTVTWNAPNNNGGAAISSYTVRLNTGATRTDNGSPFTWTGLTNGTSYSFTVQACNAAGCGPFSTSSNAIVPVGVPTRVRNLSCTGDSGIPNAPLCSWLPPANGANQIVRHEYEFGNSGLVIDNRPDLTGFAITTQPPGSTGTFRVRACSVVGCGPFANAPYSIPFVVGDVSIGLGTPTSGSSCHDFASISALGGNPNQGCYNVRITLSGWPSNQTVRCYGSLNSGVWENYATFTAGNGTHQACPYSLAGRWVVVTVGPANIAGTGTSDQGQPSVAPPSAASFIWGQWPTN